MQTINTGLGVLMLMLGFGLSASGQQAVFVPQDYPTIQSAIDASGSQVHIQLAPGTYRELIVATGVSLSLSPQSGAEGLVTLTADLDVDGADDGLLLYASGSPTARPLVEIRGVNIQTGPVEIGTADLLISECTITGGGTPSAHSALSGGSADFPLRVTDTVFRDLAASGPGGAISSPNATVERCRFERCIARNGGAIEIEQGSVLDCVFTENEADSHGGAIYITGFDVTLTGCLFRHNRATARNGGEGWGGAIHGRATITGCDFIENSADQVGGAIASTGGLITGCVFQGGIEDGFVYQAQYGGAICVEGQVRVNNCSFIGLRAFHGGAIYQPHHAVAGVFDTCRFISNHAVYTGGAIDGRAVVTDSFFFGNSAISGGAVFSIGRANHSLFYDNARPVCAWPEDGAPLSRIESNIFGEHQNITVNGFTPDAAPEGCIGSTADIGPGSIDLDPMYVREPSDGGDGWGDDPFTFDTDESANDDLGDLRLRPGSPAIDAADTHLEPGALDAGGLPRMHDDPGIPTARADIGPHEFQGESCLSDVNADGDSTPADFQAWLASFNTRGPLSDQNRDGRVSPFDFNAWIQNFNAGC